MLWLHDTELTLFEALQCSSLAGVTARRCWLECSTIGFVMHALGVCLNHNDPLYFNSQSCVAGHTVYSHTVL